MSDPGSRREREFVNEYSERAGLDAFRLAASGGGSSYALPDVVLSINPEHQLAGEMKYTTQDLCTIEPAEVSDIRGFSAQWGMTPAAIFRFSRDTTFYVVPFDTDVFEDILSKSGWLRAYREDTEKMEPLDDYIDRVRTGSVRTPATSLSPDSRWSL